MGETVKFSSSGSPAGGYLAAADGGAGLGVVVVHDQWGLVPHVVGVCDRFAEEGFTALAPDLYRGTTVPTGKPDEAREAAAALDGERAVLDLAAAVDHLAQHPAVRGKGLGVVGFGTGGGLALRLAILRADAVWAVVPFYGMPKDGAPDWGRITGAVEGHFAEHDDAAGFDQARHLETTLTDLGKDVRIFLYPNVGAAFFDDTRSGVYDSDAARQAWVRTLEFLRAKLG